MLTMCPTNFLKIFVWSIFRTILQIAEKCAKNRSYTDVLKIYHTKKNIFFGWTYIPGRLRSKSAVSWSHGMERSDWPVTTSRLFDWPARLIFRLKLNKKAKNSTTCGGDIWLDNHSNFTKFYKLAIGIKFNQWVCFWFCPGFYWSDIVNKIK